MDKKDSPSGKTGAVDTKEARTWTQVARLAGEALAALDAGKVKDTRGILLAIRGVALNADDEGS